MPRPRKFDEADVIERARRTFAETGFAGTSLDDLLAATGLGRQSLYNAFGGKKELFMRAFLSDTNGAVDAVKAVLQGTEHPIARIRTQLVSSAVEHGAAQTPPSLLVRASVELAARDAEVAATVTKAFDAIRADYAACIVDAQVAGEIEAGADAEALATYFCAVIEGMGVIGRAGVSRAELLRVGLTSLAVIPITPLGDEHLNAEGGAWR
ncbi:TetR/AcrR family transcriptional regulator [Curtobacterium sp. A7_M15]|uniref:TetR/AcrR family transcriptional regulator n=1 Tax=Curtobacterium sp. A7_M15 TaxID=3065241 RepID=UPI002737C7FF|nr:TetR/AcrR family transcriptional regulator [Curtobacterium sp. A7_M15]MDP4331910.1 TetR/AcrR family transcriptional regulator [Curtobacterium sp. A7_M15]